MHSRPLVLIWLCLMLLSTLFRPATATADTSPNRIALAISGGASMGAYEAGLIWGLVAVLRQLDTAERGALIGEPRPIDIAGIAETSAGVISKPPCPSSKSISVPTARAMRPTLRLTGGRVRGRHHHRPAVR